MGHCEREVMPQGASTGDAAVNPNGHGPQGRHTLQEWRPIQDANEWRASVSRVLANARLRQSAGQTPAGSSGDRPSASKRTTWEEVLAEVIEDDKQLEPPAKDPGV